MKYKCLVCGKDAELKEFRSTGSLLYRKMEVESRCFECAYWETLQVDDITNINYIPLIIDGHHYSVKYNYFNENNNIKAKVAILRNDGRLILTSNLISQGTIPERFRDQFPNNAIIIEKVDVEMISYLANNIGKAPINYTCPQPILNNLLEKYHYSK
jgi:hypothetical protein